MFSRAGVKYAVSHSRRPLIVVDFDETITAKDTISILAHFSYARNLPSDIPPWSHFTTAYMDDYARHKTANATYQATSLEDKTKQLASLKPVELTSLDRISKAGVFAHLTKEELQAGAKAMVQVRDHARQVLLSNIENVFILSVHWSKDWIIGSLRPLPILPTSVLSNDFVFRNGISTGEIIPSIVTADDKLKTFRQLQDKNSWSFSIYIGDSETDLLCLGLYYVSLRVAMIGFNY
jgi:phosphoserine phosphatase